MAGYPLPQHFLWGVSSLAPSFNFSVEGTTGFLLLVAYGIGPQTIGWLLISSGLPGMRASVAGLVILIQPTLDFIWEILFFDLPAGPVRIAGAVFALTAIYLCSKGRRPAKKRRKNARDFLNASRLTRAAMRERSYLFLDSHGQSGIKNN